MQINGLLKGSNPVGEGAKKRKIRAVGSIGPIHQLITVTDVSPLRSRPLLFSFSYSRFFQCKFEQFIPHFSGGGLYSCIIVRAARKIHLHFRVARQRHLVVDQ